MSSVFINNKFSDKDFGLLIENIPNFPTAAKEYDETNIPGSENGPVHIYTGRKNIEVSINFLFKCSSTDFFIKKAKIIDWLENRSSDKLVYSLNNEGYYLIKKIEIGDFVTTSRIVRRFTVKFTLYPYCYLNSGDQEIEITKETTISNNNSTCNTEPRLVVYGTGDMVIYINSRELILKGITESIVVDSFEKDCYKLSNSANKTNDKMYSKFPYLNIGDNTISFTSNVNKLIITPRWCYQ